MEPTTMIRGFGSLARAARAGATDEERAVDVVASTAAEDAHGTVVEQDWILDRYLDNPVVFFEHNQAVGGIFGGGAERPADKLPIAHAEDVRVEGNALKARIVFPPQGRSALADEVWNAIEDGRLNGVSVGFRPGEVTNEKTADGRTRYRLRRNTLFEISIVGLPSNPETLIARSVATYVADLARVAAHDLGERSVDPTPAPDAAELSAQLASAKRAIEALTARANVATTTTIARALGLDDAASAPDMLAAIDRLRKSAERTAAMEREIARRDDETAEREVDFIIRRGSDYDVAADERMRKALIIFRKTDPAGFAEAYEVPLAGLRAFDNPRMFVPITTRGGSASVAPEDVASCHADDSGDDAEFVRRVDAYSRRMDARGTPVFRSQAIDAVLRNQD